MLVGAEVSYLRRYGDYANGGSSKNHSAGVTLYGTHIGNNGMYADITLKASRMHNKFTAVSDMNHYVSKGCFNTYAVQTGIEAGKSFTFGVEENWFVDPQVQNLYGNIRHTSFKTDTGVTAHVKSMNSLIGRAGVGAGYKAKQGSAFIRADALREFTADYKAGYSVKNARNKSKVDLKDTWASSQPARLTDLIRT